MTKKKVLFCVGTRPNLIKITQFEKVFKNYNNLEYYLLHTGQHYDQNMNNVFFEELNIRKPDFQFKLEKGGQISTITQIMTKFEEVCIDLKPDLVVVPGDVNSSFACAFVANRLQIPVAHIESGLRSFDKTMPEEINRVLIDKLSELHFVTEKSGLENLRNENYNTKGITLVGNTMIDTLVHYSDEIEKSIIVKDIKLVNNQYFLFTFHRPINVDNPENLKKVIHIVKETATLKQVVFPIHPRTRINLEKLGLMDDLIHENIKITTPLGYFDFLKLIKESIAVITDSGGIQEETTFMQVPCLTIRPNTERPITTDIGTNTLLDFDIKLILENINLISNNKYKKGHIPEFWDGNTSERITKEIERFLK